MCVAGMMFSLQGCCNQYSGSGVRGEVTLAIQSKANSSEKAAALWRLYQRGTEVGTRENGGLQSWAVFRPS